MGNEEESYGYAVVLGLHMDSYKCGQICGIFCCRRTYCKISDSKVKEVMKQLKV